MHDENDLTTIPINTQLTFLIWNYIELEFGCCFDDDGGGVGQQITIRHSLIESWHAFIYQWILLNLIYSLVDFLKLLSILARHLFVHVEWDNVTRNLVVYIDLWKPRKSSLTNKIIQFNHICPSLYVICWFGYT